LTEKELNQIIGLYEDADSLVDNELHAKLDYQDYLTLKNATNAMDELIGEVEDLKCKLKRINGHMEEIWKEL